MKHLITQMTIFSFLINLRKRQKTSIITAYVLGGKVSVQQTSFSINRLFKGGSQTPISSIFKGLLNKVISGRMGADDKSEVDPLQCPMKMVTQQVESPG